MVFHELLGFGGEDAATPDGRSEWRASESVPARISCAIRSRHTPHILCRRRYLVLFARRSSTIRAPRLTVHLGESPRKSNFSEHGTGPCRAGLERLGKWDPSRVSPRTRPVAYLDSMGFLYDGVLAVHGVHFTDAELRRLAAWGPRS